MKKVLAIFFAILAAGLYAINITIMYQIKITSIIIRR